MRGIASGDYIVFRLSGASPRNTYIAYVIEGLNWGYSKPAKRPVRRIGFMGLALMVWTPGCNWVPKILSPFDLVLLRKSRTFPY